MHRTVPFTTALAGFTLPVTGAASGANRLPVLPVAAGAEPAASDWRLR